MGMDLHAVKSQELEGEGVLAGSKGDCFSTSAPFLPPGGKTTGRVLAETVSRND